MIEAAASYIYFVCRSNDDDVTVEPGPQRQTPPPCSTKRLSASVRHEREEDVAAEPLPGPSYGSTPQLQTKPKRLYTSRGTAIERELAERLERTRALKVQDEELHLLRVEEQKLKIEEQKVRLAIAKEVLQQEKLKTETLRKQALL